MFASVVASEMLYIVLLISTIFLAQDERFRAEALMWLPVMITFMVPFTLPMALSVSYGTGRILRDIKRGRMP